MQHRDGGIAVQDAFVFGVADQSTESFGASMRRGF
jgi:hypothetical protein